MTTDEFVKRAINWKLISELITGDPGNIRSTYTGITKDGKKAKYADVVHDYKEIAILGKYLIDAFLESRNIDRAIQEIEEVDKIKEGIS